MCATGAGMLVRNPAGGPFFCHFFGRPVVWTVMGMPKSKNIPCSGLNGVDVKNDLDE